MPQSRKTRLVAFFAAMAVVIATPLAVIASDRFTDVPDSNVFHDDISWLADANVTKGCNPPANTAFCPGDNVTREQMSAFMRRFAQFIDAEDGTPALADNATTADSATTAETAGDADTLDGLDSTTFVDTPNALHVFAAAYVSGTSIADSVGPVESAANTSSGEYRITFSEPLFPTGDGYAIVNVTGVSVNANTCAWSFNGDSTNEIDISCRTPDGLDSNTSFSFVVYTTDTLGLDGSGTNAGADSGR